MAMHLAGYYENVQLTATPSAITAMLDPRVYSQGDNIRVPELNYLIGAGSYVTGVAASGYRSWIDSPTLHLLANQEITPLNLGVTTTTPATDHIDWADYMMAPLRMGFDEYVRNYMAAAPAAAEIQATFLQFSDLNFGTVPSGRRIAMYGSFTAPATTGQWAETSVVWQTELPPGDYAVIGMEIHAATTLAGRLNFRTRSQWRPGVLVSGGKGTRRADYQKPGMMGVWGVYTYTQPPTLELCAVTGAAGSVVIDIVQMNAST